MMIALENKDSSQTQRNYEASIACPQNKGHHCTLQYNTAYREWIPELRAQPVGELLESSEEYPQQQPIYNHEFNSFKAQLNPFARNYRSQYAPVNMFPQNYPHDYHFQDFQYFIVIDFEATCDKEKNPYPQEIIEFPSVIVNSITGNLEACFQTYVRPAYNHVLSDFCKDLTGIQQIQVNRGVPLSDALLSHDKWLEQKGIKNTNFAVVTWSNWDCRVMLESECRFKKIRKPPYFNRWIDLRVPFREVFGGVRCNLKEAVEKAGLSWEGRAHCGLDDAKNTARLLVSIMDKGFKFSITSSLACHDGSLSWKLTQENPLLVSPQSQKLQQPPIVQQYQRYCYCGVSSSKGMIRKPGPKQGSLFFGCGNWTAARGARCHYFEWASS